MFNSLSLRLLGVFILGFVLLMTLLRIGVGHSLKNEIEYLQVGNALRMTRFIMEPPRHLRGFEPKANLARAERIITKLDQHIRVQLSSDGQQWSSDQQIKDYSQLHFFDYPLENYHLRLFRQLGSPKVAIAREAGLRVYQVKVSGAELYYEKRFRQHNFGWHFLLIVFGFLGLLYLAIRYLFAPVADIRKVVEQVSHGNFNARTKTKRKDELGQLAEQVNKMTADIEQLLESKRGLLLGISHELRTPLTRAKVALEMLEKGKYKERLETDIDEIDSIITELIEAERLSTHTSLARQVVSINQLVKDVIAEWFVSNSIRFSPLSDDPYVNIDPLRIKLLIKNLLKNAVQYSPSEETVELSLTLTDAFLAIQVKDRGIGMNVEQISRATEPFYRADVSRQRKTGGFGLGLYLCDVICQAHGGELLIESELSQGTAISAKIALI